ncbi:TIGR03668 family PPOX class F420-dependent oxidoreductase [Streptomyces fuscigenes]|uniref:TIGR03668 family PPOX class F420-dependent oxidoreductase n=1 Tax=Streptomyces fuscigenes TaxID=1528880 RepID=UPI001F275F6D|nr:TIGR03668 family PPOX class F420-dependent oxidoreductase [Streptomyces fuscigenes]MCF3960904.1 TIGR03668 family PPOX class F420-dependent oxidoreductase [Streptomyces fuscigenes]
MRLTEEEAGRRLGAARVLRLATVGPGGAPHQVPATFACYAAPGGGTRIAIAVDHKPKRHRNLRRLRNIEERPRVCVLADEYSDDWERLWWVRADGTARVLAAPAGGPAAGPGAPTAGPGAGAAGPGAGVAGPGAGASPSAAGDAGERTRALDLLAAKYPQYRERRPDGPVIVIEVERLTGWAYADPVG